MSPFHPQFRRLLRRNIPELTDEMLNSFEEYTALRHQLEQESRATPDPACFLPNLPIQDFETDINYTILRSQEIIIPYAIKFDDSLRLWTARRELALQQGNFFQVPFTPRHFMKLLAAISRYRWIRFQTFFPVTWNWMKYYYKNFSVGRAVVIVIMVALLILSWLYSTPQTEPGTKQDTPGREQPLQ